MAITVFVEGGDTEICMEFRDTEQASPSILITSVNSVSQTGCDGCSTSLEKIIPQITPSITVSATQTLTPSKQSTKLSYVYRRCSDDILIIQTKKVDGCQMGETFRANNICYTYDDIYTRPFSLKNGDRYVEYDYNFIGNEIEKFEDCESCSITSEGKSSTEINTQWSFNSCYSDICDVQGPDTTFYIQSDTNDLDGKQVWGNSQLTINYNPGRYVKIENDVYYIQMENGKSILKFYCKKGTPC